MADEPVIERGEVVASRGSGSFSRWISVAKKRYRKTTAEEEASQRERRRYIREVLRKRLERDGASREEILRMLGPPE